MNLDFKGQKAFISGSTSGIGYAIAKSLASLGCEVVVNGRTQESVDNALVKLSEDVPESRCSGFVCDFADTSQIDALLEGLGGVDILVNNVGIYTDQNFFETSDRGAVITSNDLIKQYELILKAQEGAYISVNAETKRTEIKSVTGSTIITSGTTSKQDIEIATGGVYKGSSFSAENTELSIKTGGKANVRTSNVLEVKIFSGGDVYIYGTPKQLDLVGGVAVSDMDDVLANVLTDLSMTGTLDSSLSVGAEVLGEMGKVAPRLHKKKVEQAAFLVLKSPDIPSILVETGFISNPKESSLLASPSYQDKMASAIFRGVQRWFKSNPPPGTIFARSSSGDALAERTVKVVRGDTLSGIAAKYAVSVDELMRSNSLSSKTIKIGQVLIIPESG